ncbi:hypothetical protein BT69DRAFT_280608 [Atractiella rhizophila]|nr:hypothetical protein BT69DRAFT_280608 [Atractiella rhizophila]
MQLNGKENHDHKWAAIAFQVPSSSPFHPVSQPAPPSQQLLHRLRRPADAVSNVSTPAASPATGLVVVSCAQPHHTPTPPPPSRSLVTIGRNMKAGTPLPASSSLLSGSHVATVTSIKRRNSLEGSSECEDDKRRKKRKPRMKMNEWTPQSQHSLKELQKQMRLTILLEDPFITSNNKRVRTIEAFKTLQGEVALDEEQIRHLMSWVSSYKGHFARTAKLYTRDLWKIPSGYNTDDAVDNAEEMYKLFEWWRLRFHYGDADLKNPDVTPDKLSEPFLSPSFISLIHKAIFNSRAWADAVGDCMHFDDTLPPSTLALVGTAVWHEFSREMRFYEVLGTKRSSQKAKEAAAKVQFTPEAYSGVYKAFLQRTNTLSAQTLCAINRAAGGRTHSLMASPFLTKLSISHAEAVAKDADDLAKCLGFSSTTGPTNIIDPSLLNEAVIDTEYDLDARLYGMEEMEPVVEGDADMVDYGVVRMGRLWPSDRLADGALNGMDR